jgi:hypothetical protein
MGAGSPPAFKGAQTSGTVIAVPLKVIAGRIGAHVSWPDATTAATFVLELSSFNATDAPIGAGGAGTKQAGDGNAYLAGASAQFWPDSGETIAAVVAGAAGGFFINVANVGQHRARLRISASADSQWEIYDGLDDV